MKALPIHPSDLLSGNDRLGLHVENVPLESVANEFGTPCYVYSQSAIEASWNDFTSHLAPLSPMVCFAVKANPNLAILNLLARLGSGFDIVSGGELARVIAAGGSPGKTVFSGVGKSVSEIEFALHSGVFCFNVESEAELDRIHSVAGRLGTKAPISLRVNPDVDAHTHPYIATGLKESKFGVAWENAVMLYEHAARMCNLSIRGVDCHIGSQITELSPFGEALDRLLILVEQLKEKGIPIEHIDVGGGIGICYRDEIAPQMADYAKILIDRLKGRSEHLLLEPGRRIIGNAGLLLTRVEYTKTAGDKRFALVDAAMNDLMRPALYEAWHEVRAVKKEGSEQVFDIAGPVCESGDILARDRLLEVHEGSLLAILSAGAYGSSMSSNYNTRPRPAEVLIQDTRAMLIRNRETLSTLWKDEIIPALSASI
jgi:diaminopimelate decarboxylase